MKLNLGCGHLKKEGYINLDCEDTWNPEILWNLESKLPIGTNTIDEVYASHLLEHVSNIGQLMFEIHRICKSGSSVVIIVPIGKAWQSWPEHKSPFNEDSYKYFEALTWNRQPAFRVLSKDIKKDKEMTIILEVLK